MIFLGCIFIVVGIFAVLGYYLVYREFQGIKSVKPIEKLYWEYYRRENYVDLDSISTTFKMMIIGTEDNRFFSHGGIDYRQILYAVYKDIRSLRKKMGGSTITQQLAKNLYLSFAKTYRRKMIEFFLSYYIESRLSKRQIFELYLNVIYYGKDQFGITLATNFWFHKHPRDISMNEALTLAALLPAPSKYNPLSEFNLFHKARNLALEKLQRHGLMEKKVAEKLKACKYDEVIVDEDVKNLEKFYAEEYQKREGVSCKGNLGLYGIACSELATVYLWGGLGEIITEKVIENRRQKYPEKYTDNYCAHLSSFVGQSVRGFDCSGLIKSYLMGGIGNFQYNEEVDWNSEGLLKHAKKSGSIETLPETCGVCLYMPGHVGIYLGKGYVIEATNNPKFGDGVVKTKLADRKWVKWFKI